MRPASARHWLSRDPEGKRGPRNLGRDERTPPSAGTRIAVPIPTRVGRIPANRVRGTRMLPRLRSWRQCPAGTGPGAPAAADERSLRLAAPLDASQVLPRRSQAAHERAARAPAAGASPQARSPAPRRRLRHGGVRSRHAPVAGVRGLVRSLRRGGIGDVRRHRPVGGLPHFGAADPAADPVLRIAERRFRPLPHRWCGPSHPAGACYAVRTVRRMPCQSELS